MHMVMLDSLQAHWSPTTHDNTLTPNITTEGSVGGAHSALVPMATVNNKFTSLSCYFSV